MKSNRNPGKVVPLRLVPPPAKQVSTSTIEILEELLQMARSGQLVGIIFAGMKTNDRNYYGCAGEASRDPLKTLGTLGRLWDALSEDAKEREC